MARKKTHQPPVLYASNTDSLSQRDARLQRFRVPQYWSIIFTEKDSLGHKGAYSCIIKAKSLFWAKRIILSKMKEDSPSSKIKFTGYCYWIHKNYIIARNGSRKLNIEDWANIRGAAFPNSCNILFKVPWENYRQIKLTRSQKAFLKKKGFQSGSENWSTKFRKGTSLPPHERTHKIYSGVWVDWDPEERALEKDRLIRALVKNNNNRSKAAATLGFNRNKIYSLFSKFSEIDWAKEYPPRRPLT